MLRGFPGPMGLQGASLSLALLKGADTCRLHVASFLSAVSDQVWPVGATNQTVQARGKGEVRHFSLLSALGGTSISNHYVSSCSNSRA